MYHFAHMYMRHPVFFVFFVFLGGGGGGGWYNTGDRNNVPMLGVGSVHLTLCVAFLECKYLTNGKHFCPKVKED